MFTKEFKVITRVLNGDSSKVTKLIETYKKSGTTIDICLMIDGTVEITFVSKKSVIKKLEYDLKVLSFVVIKGRIEAY